VGEQVHKASISGLGCDVDKETACAVAKLRYHGVEHNDVQPPNVL
jgi:hypothetical protein